MTVFHASDSSMAAFRNRHQPERRTFQFSLLALAAALASSFFLFSGCSRNNATVTDIDVETARGAQPGAVTARVTLRRSSFEGRDFLWGAALQWSTVGEEGQYLQAIALGNEIARLRVENGRLLITAVQSHLYESDINRPERLLASHPVLSEDAESVTIRVESASPLLGSLMDGPGKPQPRASWVRSVEHVKQGDYFLVESSVENAEGQVFEYLESLYPRETLIPLTPDSSESSKPFYLNPDLNSSAERYRFLAAGPPIWVEHEGKRVATEVATRFDISNGKTIDWYVTANAPADLMPAIKTGVEGWNRYFRGMFGRDVVRFKGVLPPGIKLGDPRFNVINWDSVRDAGSAYESQASDPLTGIQSHSLIYMPYAWYEIGLEFWRNGEFSEARENQGGQLAKRLKGLRLAGRPVRSACFHDIIEQVSLQGKQSPDAFGRELVKGVLLHEVGHALGLAHNFKGSLSLRETPGSAFSTSIMDYNQFQIEDSVFTSVDSADGPLLEYDRQILSVLYNAGRDVALSDPVVPACNDDEADARDEGVDPFCIRYDAGSDPSLRLEQTQRLIEDPAARLGETRSLTETLQAALLVRPDPSSVASRAQLEASIKDQWKKWEGTLRYYLRSGAQSWASMVALNVDSLRIHRDTDEALSAPLRSRVAKSLESLIRLEVLPTHVQAELDRFPSALESWVTTTSAWAQLSKEEQAKIDELLGDMGEEWTTSTLPKILSGSRTRAIESLVYSETSPWAIDVSVDHESAVISLLEFVVARSGDSGRPAAERVAAASALSSHSSTAPGLEAIARVKPLLEAEIKAATDATLRRDLRRVLRALD